MTRTNQPLYAVILQVRECFNRLKSLGEQLHKDLGVNPSMRAVMESIWKDSHPSVPDIARTRGVSRQHIQLIVNALLKVELVETHNNPHDRRTSLVSLTPKGQSIFEEIRSREAAVLNRLAAGFADQDLSVTLRTLATLCDAIRGESDEPS